jgi:uncharacterized protein YjiK
MSNKSLSLFLATVAALLICRGTITADETSTGDGGGDTGTSTDSSASGLASSASASLHLEKFILVKGPITLDAQTSNWSGIQNVSGMTYNKARNSLFLVMNSPETVLEFDLHKNSIQRLIHLDGFEDTEDLVSLGNNRYGIIEERTHNLVLINIPGAGSYGGLAVQTVNRSNGTVYNIDPSYDANNVGLEGVAYNALKKVFFIVKEKTPSAIYEVTEPVYGLPKVSTPFDLNVNNFGCSDFSGVYFDSKSQHLILLSDEGKAAIEITQDGTEVSRLSLTGLAQPEGICMGPDGTLYIASEPNTLYFYKKQ